jgi:ribonuclease HI
MTAPAPSSEETEKWRIFIDGASSSTGARAGIILQNGKSVVIEVSLTLFFPTSNNQAEYEAFLAGLRLAEDVRAKEIKICTDSQIIVSQVLREYQAKGGGGGGSNQTPSLLLCPPRQNLIQMRVFYPTFEVYRGRKSRLHSTGNT